MDYTSSTLLFRPIIRPGRLTFIIDHTGCVSTRTSMRTGGRPPKNFEGFVAWHFRERANVILSACNAYTSGRARVGYCPTDGHRRAPRLLKYRINSRD
ncbi:hypothetical protein GH714_039788 [Hevea brasiliensis]|uniref:Uncharacterized protein n=1 Tax=Hevea brasiliensis TaxID=3981 RepID=A0A6A6ML40_HEVBR|nr:hypothetical protein GH714_039788 [Hevea brasiliensis]